MKHEGVRTATGVRVVSLTAVMAVKRDRSSRHEWCAQLE